MTPARVLKLPAPKGAGDPRKLRRFVPPKFKAQGGGDRPRYVVRFRHHCFHIGHMLDGPGWRVFHHMPGPKPEDYSASDTLYRPGCTTGGAAKFPTKEEAMAAVLASCRAIHDGTDVIAFPARQKAKAERPGWLDPAMPYKHRLTFLMFGPGGNMPEALAKALFEQAMANMQGAS